MAKTKTKRAAWKPPGGAKKAQLERTGGQHYDVIGRARALIDAGVITRRELARKAAVSESTMRELLRSEYANKTLNALDRTGAVVSAIERTPEAQTALRAAR